LPSLGGLVAYRGAGKLVFSDLEDAAGRLQVMFRKNHYDDAAWDTILRLLDLGDWVGVKGPLFVTKMGELTVEAKEMQLLAKTVVRVPIPKSKDDRTFFQLADPETKYRERYLHWITDPRARDVFVVRSRVISGIRKFLEARGFIEVTTPTIELSYGGAEARPFTTSIHALSNQPAYLRISPELPLKRFIAGGFDKVFTICQNFRNEGIDRSHNPEFTMLEWYEAFTDYHSQMEQFESLVAQVTKEVTGSMEVTYQGTRIDFTPPWKRSHRPSAP
jgi:lysyl-tRNA synthetase class 2